MAESPKRSAVAIIVRDLVSESIRAQWALEVADEAELERLYQDIHEAVMRYEARTGLGHPDNEPG